MSSKKKKGGIKRVNKSQQTSAAGKKNIPKKGIRDPNASSKESSKKKGVARRSKGAQSIEPVAKAAVKRVDKNKASGVEEKARSVKRTDKNKTSSKEESQSSGIARKDRNAQAKEVAPKPKKKSSKYNASSIRKRRSQKDYQQKRQKCNSCRGTAKKRCCKKRQKLVQYKFGTRAEKTSIKKKGWRWWRCLRTKLSQSYRPQTKGQSQHCSQTIVTFKRPSPKSKKILLICNQVLLLVKFLHLAYAYLHAIPHNNAHFEEQAHIL